MGTVVGGMILGSGAIKNALDAWRWVNGTLLYFLTRMECKWLPENPTDSGYGQSSTRLLCEVVRRSSIVLWRHDLRMAASRGGDLFRESPFDESLLKFDPQLWVYDRCFSLPRVQQELGVPQWYTMVAAAQVRTLPEWKKGPGMMSFHIFLPSLDGMSPNSTVEDLRPIVIADFVHRGEKPGDSGGMASLLGMLNFMNLDIVATETERLPRPFRRRLEREGKPEPDIRVVALRRTRHPNSTHSHGDVDWSCQWVVKGHWRNQWYPSREEHYPVFVCPYIKGPEGKPLKAETPTVFDVRR